MRKQINNISKHTIADLYRDTTEAERVELIDGQYYHMPMVNTLHQQLMSEISSQICSYMPFISLHIWEDIRH